MRFFKSKCCSGCLRDFLCFFCMSSRIIYTHTFCGICGFVIFEAILEDIETVKKKTEFVTRVSSQMRREIDLTDTKNQQKLAKNVFVFGCRGPKIGQRKLVVEVSNFQNAFIFAI